MNEHELLAQFSRTRSPELFQQIVQRYVDFIFATARRQLRDEHLAQDVTQAVFLLLAKKAGSLPTNRPVLAWLHKATCYASANAARSVATRRRHEQNAAEIKMDRANEPDELSSLLDEGIARLRKSDRNAIFLKFFEKKSHREIAGAMGISEEAAAKRVSRAIEKLRDYFRRRGIAVTSAAIGSTLAVEATHSAPQGLAATVESSSSGSTAAVALSKGAMILMTTAKIKAVAVAVIFILLVLIGGGIAVRSFSENPPKIIEPPKIEPTSTSWNVQYGDAKLELIAIGDPSDGSWWLPDGTPRPAPFERLMSADALKAPGETKRRIVCYVQGIDRQHDYFSPGIDGVDPSIISYHDQADKIVIDLIMGFPTPPANSGDVTINFATGPWEKTVTYDLASPKPGESDDFAIQSVTSNENKTIVEAKIAEGARDREVVAILPDGKEKFPDGIGGGLSTMKTYTFPLPKDQVKQILSRSRPFLKSVIQNVSLQSDHKTNPAVNILPSTPPTTNPS
jgi:RNA polymerase sigma factor (sigma-70 family)